VSVLTMPMPPRLVYAEGPLEPDLHDMLLTGATYRQIDWWCRAGYLSAKGQGSGTVRRWTARDWRMAYLIVRFLDAGFTLGAAHDLAVRSERGEWTCETPSGVRIEWKVKW
jgi:DNA-binding transcriptional MerR regulator